MAKIKIKLTGNNEFWNVIDNNSDHDDSSLVKKMNFTSRDADGNNVPYTATATRDGDDGHFFTIAFEGLTTIAFEGLTSIPENNLRVHLNRIGIDTWSIEFEKEAELKYLTLDEQQSAIFAEKQLGISLNKKRSKDIIDGEDESKSEYLEIDITPPRGEELESESSELGKPEPKRRLKKGTSRINKQPEKDVPMDAYESSRESVDHSPAPKPASKVKTVSLILEPADAAKLDAIFRSQGTKKINYNLDHEGHIFAIELTKGKNGRFNQRLVSEIENDGSHTPLDIERSTLHVLAIKLEEGQIEKKKNGEFAIRLTKDQSAHYATKVGDLITTKTIAVSRDTDSVDLSLRTTPKEALELQLKQAMDEKNRAKEAQEKAKYRYQHGYKEVRGTLEFRVKALYTKLQEIGLYELVEGVSRPSTNETIVKILNEIPHSQTNKTRSGKEAFQFKSTDKDDIAEKLTKAIKRKYPDPNHDPLDSFLARLKVEMGANYPLEGYKSPLPEKQEDMETVKQAGKSGLQSSINSIERKLELNKSAEKTAQTYRDRQDNKLTAIKEKLSPKLGTKLDKLEGKQTEYKEKALVEGTKNGVFAKIRKWYYEAKENHFDRRYKETESVKEGVDAKIERYTKKLETADERLAKRTNIKKTNEAIKAQDEAKLHELKAQTKDDSAITAARKKIKNAAATLAKEKVEEKHQDRVKKERGISDTELEL